MPTAVTPPGGPPAGPPPGPPAGPPPEARRGLTGHTAAVTCVALPADGRFVLSGSDDHTLRLWDPARGEEIRRWDAHEDGVKCVALSPDGRLAVSGGVWGPACLWDTSTGTEIRRLQGQQMGTMAAAFSPEGRLVATGGGDCTVRCWDPMTGQELRRLQGHTADVTAIAFSPDRRLVLSGDMQVEAGDDHVRLWDLEGGKELCRLGQGLLVVTAVAFASRGALALATTMDGWLHRWEAATGRELGNVEVGAGSLLCLAVSPDGRGLLTGSGTDFHDRGTVGGLGADNTVRLLDPADCRELHRFEAHAGNVNDVAFTSDGRQAVSASADRTVRIWDVPEQM
ncbi:WD40 repeat domain-containing protein [Streptomyces collinus]|uniref:WD40 repeat domain-containing protein n=1 Tax=Streptomyces collinus TaxID=42684 RepID=UPI0029420D70|nr:WD40 repeat domain-containing protein [Streptomyces collinus]